MDKDQTRESGSKIVEKQQAAEDQREEAAEPKDLGLQQATSSQDPSFTPADSLAVQSEEAVAVTLQAIKAELEAGDRKERQTLPYPELLQANKQEAGTVERRPAETKLETEAAAVQLPADYQKRRTELLFSEARKNQAQADEAYQRIAKSFEESLQLEKAGTERFCQLIKLFQTRIEMGMRSATVVEAAASSQSMFSDPKATADQPSAEVAIPQVRKAKTLGQLHEQATRLIQKTQQRSEAYQEFFMRKKVAAEGLKPSGPLTPN